MGCGDLFSACVKHDYEVDEDDEEIGDEDHVLAVNPEPVVLVNGQESFTAEDGCTAEEDEGCTSDTGLVASGVSVAGALESASLMPARFTAGGEPGVGELFVSVKTDAGKSMAGSAVVQVVLPDGANLKPHCVSGAAASPPLLVPRASRLRVSWAFTLDGVERSGWTGEIPVEAPQLTLLESITPNVADYLTADTVGAGQIVSSTLGGSSFELETYDVSGAGLTLETYPPSGAYLAYGIHIDLPALGGRATCVNPSMTLTLSTPEVCSFGSDWMEPASTLVPANSGLFTLLPHSVGTCSIVAEIDGTSVSEAFDLEVAQIPP